MSADDPDLGPSPLSQLVLRMMPKGDAVALFRKERYEREQRRAEALRDAVTESITLEDLLTAMRGDERVEQMFRDAVAAASASTSDEKIRLLGRVVATGAADQAKVDAAAVLLRVAVELDPIEVRSLVAIDRGRDPLPPLRDSPDRPPRFDGDPIAFLSYHLKVSQSVADRS